MPRSFWDLSSTEGNEREHYRILKPKYTDRLETKGQYSIVVAYTDTLAPCLTSIHCPDNFLYWDPPAYSHNHMSNLLWRQHDYQTAWLGHILDRADLHNHLLEWRRKHQYVVLTWSLCLLAHSFCTLAHHRSSIHYLGTLLYSIRTAYSHNHMSKLLWRQHNYQIAWRCHILDWTDLHNLLEWRKKHQYVVLTWSLCHLA